MTSGSAPGAPSARILVRATAAAVILAATLLITIVLPVEYGFDPLRTGRALGLLREPAETAAATTPTADTSLTPQVSGPLAQFGASYRTDQVTFDLGPYDYLEYKYLLAAGASLTFTWEATAPVISDFHGAREDASNNEVSYAKATRHRDAGSLTAPFAGMHGWYWENPGGSPITVRLATSGFYQSATEFRSNRSRRSHDLGTPLPSLAAPAH